MKGWENYRVDILPEHVLRMLSPAERKRAGKGALLRKEAIAIAEARTEKELQKNLLTLLQEHRGIVVIYSRMDKKPTTPEGTPDFIFAVAGGTKMSPGDDVEIEETFACAWEMKTETGEQSADQVKMMTAMTTHPNAWRYRVIRSTEEARRELAEMGLRK